MMIRRIRIQGADIRPTLEFCSHFNGASVLKLQINYRSTPAILNSANRINSDKPAAYRKILVSGNTRKNGSAPRAFSFGEQEEMLDWNHEAGGDDPEQRADQG
jgi:superfamily I DNA/RNA helicase